MSILYLLILAVIQGVTEFLPISSSGHLILLPNLAGLADQGPIIDVAAHVGTLAAVVLYFWADVRTAALGLPQLAKGRIDSEGSKLAFLLLLSTIPVILFGLFLSATGLDEAIRSITVIGWTMLGFGLVLYWADQKGPVQKEESQWSVKDALWMGLAQMLALIHGTSRSGITITAGRWLGYTRHDAAKLSMLMSIPTILASGGFLALKVILSGNFAPLLDGAIVAVMSFAAALLALTLMMRLLRSVSFTPYVIYRVVFGLILLWIGYSR